MSFGQLDATPYLFHATRKPGRPRMGRRVRVQVGGASVDVATRRLLRDWCRVSRQSRGVILDQLCAFAVLQAFSPAANLSVRKRG